MTFLRDFVTYMKTRTDSPPDFHLHGGMVALAACLGNQVWCDGWSRPVYPNLWVVNIAPSGYGKSTTLDMAQSLCQRAGIGDRMLPSAFSHEALIRRLADAPEGFWLIQEFGAFMGTLARDYNAGAMQTLTELFDVPDEYTRILGVKEPQKYTLKHPCISILGASSPDWFAATFRESALRGGFLARFIFCPSAEAGEYVGHPGARRDSAEVPLVYHLDQVRQMHGKMELGAVMRDFRDWDFGTRERLRTDCPPEFSGMRSRAGLLVLKAAMLFHAAREPDSMTIEPRDLANAITYVEDAQGKAELYLTDEVANDKEGELRIKIIGILRRADGPMLRGQVLKRCKKGAREFQQAIDTLIQTGEVGIEHERGSRGEWLILRSPFPVNSRGIGERSNGAASSPTRVTVPSLPVAR